MANDLSLDAWLRGKRAQKAQTQSEAAAEIGVSTNVIGRWEGGELPRKIVDIAGLAQWAGVHEVDVYERIARARTKAAASDTEAA